MTDPDDPSGPPDADLRRPGDRFSELVRVMAELRAPGGCPWDAEQTHRSLARHLLEETHETLQAIDADDLGALREELGDVLLQVVFHAEIAEEEGAFSIDDVTDALISKLIRRHPHVFGDVEVSGADDVLANWERLKAEETGPRDFEDDIPETLPALARAAKVQRRAEAAGAERIAQDVASSTVLARLEELRSASDTAGAEEALGDLLFVAVAIARDAGIDAESALRRRTRAFADS
ncbi:MAG: nucleoside triphosphate pyrophosphohydrolase [Actinomycetota bacterium]|nr:nucleoside triphosphate pyrophosphohydrolase [Actinomycetota bacterium]